MTLKEYLIENRYNIGFIQNPLEDVITGAPVNVKWMKHHYKDRWFADPFILDVTDNAFVVLAEEWYDPIKRGRISKLTIDRKSFSLIGIKPILQLDTHLSFPAIQRIKNNIYIIPENSAAGCLKRYLYLPQTEELIEIDTISNERLTDSVFFIYQGKDVMLSTKLPDANGKDLGVYERMEDGTYKLIDTFHFEENIARMAGNIFEYKGKLYRPAQVCINSYGDAVSLQEITSVNGKFYFTEIRRIYSPSKLYDLGFHTFNVNNEHIVVDGLGYRRPIIAHLLRNIWHLFKPSKRPK